MFANTRLFSPVAIEGITTAPKDSREYREWWLEEERRCIHGYSVAGTRITGPHYHYLNHWKILALPEGGMRKRLMRPKFLDIDYEFYHNIEKAKEQGKHALWLKRRQVGWSYKSSELGGHEFTFVPDSYTIYTSGLALYSENTMAMMITGLDKAAGTPFYRKRTPNETTFIKALFKAKVDGHDTMLGYNSTAEQITATSPQAFVGRTPSLVIYEEIGKFTGFLDVKAYTEAAVENEGMKTGLQLFFGTGGEENESIDEVMEAFYKPEQYNFMCVDNDYDEDDGVNTFDPVSGKKTQICFFVPGWQYKVIDKDGNSLKEESIKALMDERELAKNTKNYLQKITQYPLTPQEAFLSPDGGRFNVVKLRQQRLSILRRPDHDSIVEVGKLEWDYGPGGVKTGVSFTKDPTGPFRIVEHPDRDQSGAIPSQAYVAGTDSYDRDQVSSGKGSLGSCYMYKMLWSVNKTSDLFVASLTQRPDTSAEFYENTAKLCMYYGGAMNLVEYSMFAIGQWYERNGFLRLLKERPEIAYQMQESAGPQNRFGIDPATKPIWITKLADYIEDNAHQIHDIEALTALIRYRDKHPNGKPYNCDRTIAMSLARLHAEDNLVVMSSRRSEPTYKTPERHYGLRNGRMQVYFE